MKPYQAMREHDLRGDKHLGQHILVDPHAVREIVDGADLDAGDLVLEVGPGPGTLTAQLAELAAEVIAVELDERMLVPLREALAGHDNVRVVQGDILEQDVAELVGQRPYKVVANLPYYITSAVLRHLLSAPLRPDCLVVTVQREVADRIVGRPGRRQRHKQEQRMSLLAVSVQFYGQPRILARIPAGAFRPVPSVDSAVVRIDTYDPLPWGVVDEALFFEVARAGFAQSRKQLRNALRLGLPYADEETDEALARSGIDPRRRAETLSVAEWVALSNALAALRQDG
ncbi:MAG TPA: 16S rRNA (adenine(1518)-N(6)/adenine(1519)-N(6))-dimethyltransferase RsmA [Anaerolineae bacterium]|nr:16S rRNA (adenine(1518)-N(6)/adenine(1519)-N(6))-dimethyltransferase RsmA [Anaerolineae bacterium]